MLYYAEIWNNDPPSPFIQGSPTAVWILELFQPYKWGFITQTKRSSFWEMQSTIWVQVLDEILRFRFVLMQFGKAWIRLFLTHLWVSRADWLGNHSRRKINFKPA